MHAISRGGTAIAALAALALGMLGTGGAAHAQTFSVPQPLSSHGYGNALQLGVDQAGDMLATWADEGGWYSLRPAGGAWTAPTALYAGGGLWFQQTTPAGAATIVSYTSLYGVWSVDRPPGGTWSAPALLVNAPQVIIGNNSGAPHFSFVQDARGDQAIVFETYVPGTTTLAIVVLRRPAGGTWGPLEIAASSTTYGNIVLEGAAIGGKGDVVVAFETFTVSCGVRSCEDGNFIVHASREAAASKSWVDSGPMTPPSTQYDVQPVVDGNARAALFVEAYLSGAIQTTTQAHAGAKWRPFATAFSNPNVDLVQTYGTSVENGDRASLGFDAYGTPGLFPTLLEGSLVTNAAPVVTAFGTTDPIAPNAGMVYAESANGAAVVTWADADGSVRVSTRRSAAGAWSAAQTIVAGSPCNVGGVVCTAPVAAAIDNAGHAVVGFRRFDSSVTYSTVYVSND